jgi:hypothetical protein
MYIYDKFIFGLSELSATLLLCSGVIIKKLEVVSIQAIQYRHNLKIKIAIVMI